MAYVQPGAALRLPGMRRRRALSGSFSRPKIPNHWFIERLNHRVLHRLQPLASRVSTTLLGKLKEGEKKKILRQPAEKRTNTPIVLSMPSKDYWCNERFPNDEKNPTSLVFVEASSEISRFFYIRFFNENSEIRIKTAVS